jgi:DNA-binding response OmpR family regulator
VKILLISTSRTLMDNLTDELQTSGFTIETAPPRLADKVALRESHDVILLDLDSTKDLKFGWIAKWRRCGVTTKILVLVPGAFDADDRVRCLDDGADDYLAKPYSDEELLARLRAMTRNPQVPEPGLKKVHDLEIDVSLYTVSRAGRQVQLTVREFELLQFLIQHQGKIVKRTFILESLYPHLSDDRRSNVIDVYVSYLRKKIDNNPDRPLIVTHWGKGYEFLRDKATAIDGRP